MTTEVEELKTRIALIESELANLKTTASSRQEEQRESSFRSIIAEAQNTDPKLASKPNLTIAIRPKTPREVPRLFAGAEAEVVQILEKGIQERSGGFGLSQAYPHSRVVRGLYRLASSPGHDLRLVTKEATCVFIASADNSFLSWAMTEQGSQLRLNPIAIVEYVYSTAVFTLRVAELTGHGGEPCELVTDWGNISTNGRQLMLPTSRVNTMGFLMGSGHAVEEAELRSSSVIDLPVAADVLGYQILKAIYNQAGASDASIPYTIKGQEKLDIQGLSQQ